MKFPNSLKDKLTNIKQLAEAIMAESQPQEGHGDPESYSDCWRFLIDDLDEIIETDLQPGCFCDPNETWGETSVMCCNKCGKPVEDFWKTK